MKSFEYKIAGFYEPSDDVFDPLLEKMLNDVDFADVVLHSNDERSLKAHKVVLASKESFHC